MAARNQVNASLQASERRQNAADRRAAHLAALATQQADLKREAADRQTKRDRDSKRATRAAAAPPKSPK